jgi:hypothetical protein
MRARPLLPPNGFFLAGRITTEPNHKRTRYKATLFLQLLSRILFKYAVKITIEC